MSNQTREVQAAEMLKAMKLFITEHEHDELAQAIADANGDQAKYRIAVAHAATYQLMLNARDWAVGMKTMPGDVVYDPARIHKYVYAHNLPLNHTDPNLYPGADGADYWILMPQVHDFIKVFPDKVNAKVAVKYGDIWWDPPMEHKFIWVGEDKDDCTEPPQANHPDWNLV